MAESKPNPTECLYTGCRHCERLERERTAAGMAVYVRFVALGLLSALAT